MASTEARWIGVFQLAHVARPGITLQHAGGFLGKLEQRTVFRVGDLLQKILRQQPDIVRPGAQAEAGAPGRR